jgi:membrane protease subunit HflC
MRAFLALLIIIVGLAAASIYASAFIVHQNEQALVLRFGEPKRVVREPGLNWKYPLIDTVEVYDKRILDLDSQPQEVTASDQKRLVVDSFARYKIVDPLKFYQTLRYEEGVRSRLGPIVDSTLRRVLGGSTFQEVVRDKREDLMKRIASTVNTEGEDFGLQVVDVRISPSRTPRACSTACGPSASARPPSSAAKVPEKRTASRRPPIARRRSSGPRPPVRPKRRAVPATPSATRSTPMPTPATRSSSSSTARCRPTSAGCALLTRGS